MSLTNEERSKWDGVDNALSKFGFPTSVDNREEVIKLLKEEIVKEYDEEGDQFLMRLLCAQLFSIGNVEDSLLIWEAKSCCFDTMLGIDVQFLFGAGLERTKSYLTDIDTEKSLYALEYISKCNSDFIDFSVENIIEQTKVFYNI
jgi:hypothetical protein